MKSAVVKALARWREGLLKECRYSVAGSRPKKVLFDHLFKCGGSSVRAFLQANYPSRKTFTIDGFTPTAAIAKFKQLGERARHGYDLVHGHGADELIDYVHPESLKVVLLRDPVERIISHYHYARSLPVHYLHSQINVQNLSLEQYVTSNLSAELRNWYVVHFTRMSADEAEKDPEASVSRAFEIIQGRYGVFGLLENYSEFVGQVRQAAGLRYGRDDERINVTPNRPTAREVEPSAIEAITRVNHLDMMLYKKIRAGRGQRRN